MKPQLKSYDSSVEALLCTPEELRIKNTRKLKNYKDSLRIVDLFSGCGGLSLGTMQAAHLCRRSISIELAIDNNPMALEVYRHNFKHIASRVEARNIEEYVDTESNSTVPRALERRAFSGLEGIDLIVAGPPCQGHSDLNNSSRRSDPRNLLYLAPVRAAVNLRPKAILIENVPTVTRAAEDVVSTSRMLLKRLGYDVREFKLDLTQLGVPQSRTRHIQLASLSSLDSVALQITSLVTRMVRCIDYIRDIVDEPSNHADSAFIRTTKLSLDNVSRINYLFKNSVYDLPNALRPSCHRDRVHSYVSMYGRMHAGKPAQTITSGFGSMGQGRFVHPTRPRMISAHEAARLQGFPDYFRFDSCQRVTSLREMIGNAVPPLMAQALGKAIIAQLQRRSRAA